MARKAERPTRYFGEGEVAQLLDVTRRKRERHMALRLGFASGARVGEMRTLRLEDMKEAGGGFIVDLIDSKKRKRRAVPVDPDVVSDVQGWARDTKLKPRDLLFQVSAMTLNRWIREAAGVASVTWDHERENLRWHSVRGTFIRYHRDKPMKWLEQVTGDDWETLRTYYTEFSISDLVKIHHGEPLGGGSAAVTKSKPLH